MCGISGIIHKNPRSEGLAPVGQELINMLDSLKHRGMDSSGVTVSAQVAGADFIVRLWTDTGNAGEDLLARVEEKIFESGGVIRSHDLRSGYLLLAIDYDGDIQELGDVLLHTGDVYIHSIGRVS